jgi:hypothetical protein
MSKLQKTQKVPFAALAVFAGVATLSSGQLPTSSYTISGSRGTYKGTLVGADPFAGPSTAPVTIDVVVVPLVVEILGDGTATLFDPTANNCNGGYSAVYRFQNSPLVVPSDLSFNGVDVGTVQYIDGFMRAEFWNAPDHSRSKYKNNINWIFVAPYVFPALTSQTNISGIVTDTGCSARGIVSRATFNTYLEDYALPALQKANVISTKQFVLFLTQNVVTSGATPISNSDIDVGQHHHTGSQTWAMAAYDSNDVLAASHEIAEWMNDPFLNNRSPAWGFIGEFPKGCSSYLEVGDPVNGRKVAVETNGYTYHVQELAFFSWFFASPSDPSFGAGGAFSSNGHFTGPSKDCTTSPPSGGTW